MDFSQMDLKEKILIGGGGALVLFFLFKSIAGRGGSAPAPVDQGKIEQDLGNQVAGAVNQAAAQFDQSNQQALQGISQMVAGIQDNLTKQVNGISQQVTSQGVAQQHQIDSLNQSTQSLLNQMPKQVDHSSAGPDLQSMTVSQLQALEKSNSADWFKPGADQTKLHDQNQQIENILHPGNVYDKSTGTYSYH